MRFYTVALIFMIFDIEIAFLFPWAAVFKDPSVQSVVLAEGVIFVGILFLGLVYVWAKGELDWIKAFSEGKAVVTGVNPSDFTSERQALYEPDASAEQVEESGQVAEKEEPQETGTTT